MLRGYLRRHIGNVLLAGGETIFVKITNIGFQYRFVLPGTDAVKPDITFAPLGAFRGCRRSKWLMKSVAISSGLTSTPLADIG